MRGVIIDDPDGQSARIAAQIEESERFVRADIVALYWPLPGEVDLRALIGRWAGRKRIALPSVVGRELVWREFTGELTEGRFGIGEATGAPIEPQDIDLVVVPGMAFTASGERLGRGGGYYDRALKKMRAYRVGVSFRERIVKKIAHKAYDIAMDGVLF